MTPQSQLEHKGNFQTHPFAELIAEISHGRVSGSLRLVHGDKKCILYFKSGKVAFGVSNARTSRLFYTLLNQKRINQNDLALIPEFANDIALADFLEDRGILTKDEKDRLFIEQIRAIIVDILAWNYGEWSFTSLARLRDGLSFNVEAESLLVEYGRCLTSDEVLARFRNLDETFARVDVPDARFSLNTNELSVMAKLSKVPTKIAEITSSLSLPEHVAIHVLYTLWLGGMVHRGDWSPAFSDISITKMRDARLELKQEAIRLARVRPPEQEDAGKTVRTLGTEKAAEIKLTLDEYLTRVESAETYYDVLGVDHKAEVSEIKRAYFGLAKVFHPDHYHQEGPDVLRRVQFAFTELAQAHETLKNAETRENYDFKVRKELAAKEKLKSAGTYEEITANIQLAAESFDRGFSLLMEDEIEAATQLLARAAHLDPKSARYHAYYGKALSADKKQRHKAESEMQAAIRIDANNPTFRVMLAEFFIEMNLLKRAEGELNRLLTMFPSNREAREMLASLQQKV